MVHRDQLWGTAADDGDEGWDGQVKEAGWGDGLREGAEVFLTILDYYVSVTRYQISSSGEKRADKTYTTEEMPYKDHQYPPRNVWSGIYTLEWHALSIAV